MSLIADIVYPIAIGLVVVICMAAQRTLKAEYPDELVPFLAARAAGAFAASGIFLLIAKKPNPGGALSEIRRFLWMRQSRWVLPLFVNAFILGIAITLMSLSDLSEHERCMGADVGGFLLGLIGFQLLSAIPGWYSMVYSIAPDTSTGTGKAA